MEEDTQHPSPAETALITEWINRVARGDRDELERMAPEILHALFSIARGLRQKNPGQPLETRAVVNEFFLRFLSGSGTHFENRSRFFAFAARVMRNFIVDEIRKHRGRYVELDGIQVELANPFEDHDLLEIDATLEKLRTIDSQKYEVACCRLYLGLKTIEIAEYLDMSPRTVERKWGAAKLWITSLLYGTEA